MNIETLTATIAVCHDTKPVVTTFNRKVAKNRGNCRIWIEGKKLLDAGINNGDRFHWQIANNQVVLTFKDDSFETRKVSGNPSRPIIDINSSELNPILGNGTHYTVTVSKNLANVTTMVIEQACTTP